MLVLIHKIRASFVFKSDDFPLWPRPLECIVFDDDSIDVISFAMTVGLTEWYVPKMAKMHCHSGMRGDNHIVGVVERHPDL